MSEIGEIPSVCLLEKSEFIPGSKYVFLLLFFEQESSSCVKRRISFVDIMDRIFEKIQNGRKKLNFQIWTSTYKVSLCTDSGLQITNLIKLCRLNVNFER